MPFKMAAPCMIRPVSYFQDLFRGLQILTTSSASRHNLAKGESQQLMENILQQNITNFIDWLMKCERFSSKENLRSNLFKLTQSDEDVRKKFATLCLFILQQITGLLIQAETSKQDVKTRTAEKSGSSDQRADDAVLLSLEQTKIISLSLQFLVVLGVIPYLSEGVGIPVSHRLGPGQILLASSHVYSQELSEVQRLHSLSTPLRFLSNALQVSPLKDLVMKNHLSDLISTLIQVRRSAKIVLQHYQNCAHCEKEEFHPTCKTNENERETEQVPLSLSTASDKSQTTDEWDPNINEKSLHETISLCNTEMDSIFSQEGLPSLLQEMLTLAGLNKGDKTVKTPPWFRRVVVCIIRDIIMKPSGVQQLITPLVSETKVYDTKDWKKCEAVARIISHCPVTKDNIKAFYSSVSQQLIDLIRDNEIPVPKIVTVIVGEAISQLTDLQVHLMEEFCLSRLKSPLLRCCSLHESGSSDVLVDEKELTSTVICLHRLYVQGQTLRSPFCSTLQPVVGVLFGIFLHARNGISQLRSLTKDLLCCYLSCLDISKGVACLLELLVPIHKETCLHSSLRPDVVLVPGSNSGLQVVVSHDVHDDLNSWMWSSEAVLELLSCVKSDSLTSELFLTLLQRLTSIVTSEITATDDIILPVRCMSLETKTAELKELKSKTALLSLISGIGEAFGHAVIANTHQVLLFSQITLRRCLEIHRATDEQSTRSFEIDTLTMAMGLLMATLSSRQKFSDKDKKVLDELLPLMAILSGCENMPFHVKEMARNLKVVVATRGHVWPDLRKQNNSQSDERMEEEEIRLQAGKTATAKPLIEVLADNATNNQTPANDSRDNQSQIVNEATPCPKTQLQQALDDIKSSLVPIQGHGLISLARMLEDRHPDAVEQKDALLKIFMTHLSHNDSYIYLAAVNGLSALSDLCADDVVPCLSSQFHILCLKLKAQSPETLETTLKVGEALVKTTQRLGEMASRYRDVVLPPFLCGCCHNNEMVRASCLSGLADICKLLRLAINPVLQEVLTCCCDVMRSDPCCEPRRAAALTITSLLQGLGKEAPETLNSGLKELYHVLKHSANFDPDEKVKLHTTLALNELEDIMKSLLFPEQKLQKKISILGYQ